jgi:hypothetical protein
MMKDKNIESPTESKEIQTEDKKQDNTKELEELRKFKSEVEAKQKAEQEKPKEVRVSDTFFSTKETVKPFKPETNMSSELFV